MLTRHIKPVMPEAQYPSRAERARVSRWGNAREAELRTAPTARSDEGVVHSGRP